VLEINLLFFKLFKGLPNTAYLIVWSLVMMLKNMLGKSS